MSAKPTLRQYAALPIDLRSGRIEIVLITSRSTGRWLIPKGRPEPRMRGHEVARLEAFEEAGLVGVASAKALGTFLAEREMADATASSRVTVYPFRVEGETEDYPEKGQRQIVRASFLEALMMLSDGGLVSLLLRNEHRLLNLLPPPSLRPVPKD